METLKYFPGKLFNFTRNERDFERGLSSFDCFHFPFHQRIVLLFQAGVLH